MDSSQWLMRIDGALSAHFFQPDGSSRPGTDWAVSLSNGDRNYKVIVRAYLDESASRKTRADHEYQGRTVTGYLRDRLDQGWTPVQPGALSINIQDPPVNTDGVLKKPWWRFW